MSTTTGHGRALRRGRTGVGWAEAVVRLLVWPVRVHRARRVMLQLIRLDEHELRDIGLTGRDLSDASALPCDEDPSLYLHRRVEARRRGH